MRIEGKTVKPGTSAENLLRDLSFSPSLCFLFYPSRKSREASVFCKQLSGFGIQVVGISGGGTISRTLTSEYDENFSLLLMDISTSDFKVMAFSPEEIRNGLKREFIFSEFSLLAFASPDIFVIFEDLMDTLRDELTPKIFGGVACMNSFNESPPEPSLIINERIIDRGIVGVFFNEKKVSLQSVSYHGWSSICLPMEVTKVYDYTIQEIEEKKALEFVEGFTGELKEEFIRTCLLPLCLVDRIDCKGNFPLATIKSINRETGEITLFARVKKGEKISLSIPPTFQDLIERFPEVGKIFPNSKGMIIISCLGRRYFLGLNYELEIVKLIESTSAPFAGFFSCGEYGSFLPGGKPMFLNQTITIVSIEEK